ncbi:MAG: hypothetical protein JWM72_3589 [Actinomycetia bacterium]|nr:hypothetical protein [Actinomycetes bacterium]
MGRGFPQHPDGPVPGPTPVPRVGGRFPYPERAERHDYSRAEQDEARRLQPTEHGPVHDAHEFAGGPGADRGHCESRPDDDVERGEGEDALAAGEPRLDRSHAGRERPRDRGTEGGRAEQRELDRRREAERRDDRTQGEHAGARRSERVEVPDALQRQEAARSSHAEQCDKHAELGIARVQHRPDEFDPEREQRAEPERDRDRRGHDRAHERQMERVAEADVRLGILGDFAAFVVRSRLRVFGARAGWSRAKLGAEGHMPESRDHQCRDHERGRVEREDERERPAEDVAAGERRDERVRRRAERNQPVRRTEDQTVGLLEVVLFDELRNQRVARRKEHQAGDLDVESPEVDPPQSAYQRDERDHHGPDEVHRDHRLALRPAGRGARGERSAEGGGQETQREHTADRGRRPRLLIDERDERERPHPIAERGDGLTHEQGSERSGRERGRSHVSGLSVVCAPVS